MRAAKKNVMPGAEICGRIPSRPCFSMHSTTYKKGRVCFYLSLSPFQPRLALCSFETLAAKCIVLFDIKAHCWYHRLSDM